MSLLKFLSSVSVACVLAVSASAAEPLSPRAEVGLKGGTDRSLLTTEFWAPLAQKSDRVLYGDIRLMGDNDENREGNLGLGYRQIVDDAVLGVHGWIDRRRTQNNSTFHQVTLGVERLGHIVDARANMYVPLNNTRQLGVASTSAPYLAGSGIFYDINGFLVETPQYGLDGEVGYRMPVFQKQADAIRVYGGGYHFFRDDTQDVTGFRVRTEAQINSAFSIGARFQHDSPRGSQGFLEATVKFPFGAKKLYQTDYLRARLDESPERDVDIVTASTISNSQKMVPVINNTNGNAQRILYVDNTNTQSGNGSKENPFNTLSAAQAALQAHDILYVARGNGTTSGMDQGLVIDKANVQLIGSGSALSYNGFTLLDAGSAPVITNNQTASADHVIGSGIVVTNDNVSISGVTISNPQKHGVYVATLNGETFQHASVDNSSFDILSVSNNNYAFYFHALNGGTIKNISFTNSSTLSGNGNIFSAAENSTIENVSAHNITGNGSGREIMLIAQDSNARILKADISNITKNNTTSTAVYLTARRGGLIENVTVDQVIGNGAGGTFSAIRLDADNGAMINNIDISNTVLDGNNISSSGFYAQAATGARIQNVTFSDAEISNFSNSGINLSISGTGVLENIQLSNIVTRNNSLHGVIVLATNSGLIDQISLSNITTHQNQQSGIFLSSTNTGLLNNMTLTGIDSYQNMAQGMIISTTGAGNIDNVTVANSTFRANEQSGIFVNHDSTGILNASLGDMTAGSGNNRFFSNNTSNTPSHSELRLDLNNGIINAMNNWWGQAGGPLASQITSESGCPSCGTADTSNALNSDPVSSP